MLSGKLVLRGLFIALFPLLIAGCAPPALHQIASWVADGLLYATTGKGTSDHVISIAMQKDCAMWRVIRGMEICIDRAPAENDAIMVVMGEDGTLAQDDLDAIAGQLSAIETAADGEVAPEYRGVMTANLSFGKMVLSPRKKRYELSAGIADTETDTATARVVGSLSTRVATAAADNIQEDSVSPIIPATMSFGRPVTFADKFIRSPRKRNRFMLSSVPARQPFGRPVRTDYSQLSESVPEPAVTSVSERAKLQAVSTSPRDFSNGGSRQLAALSMADDSLFSVTGITKKTPAVSSKISTVVPAIKPVPGTSSRHLVLGSFRNRLNADAFSKQLGAFKAFVATVQLPSGTYYRVLAGPSSGESLEGLKSRYIQATGAESWVVTLSQPMPSKTAVLR